MQDLLKVIYTFDNTAFTPVDKKTCKQFIEVIHSVHSLATLILFLYILQFYRLLPLNLLHYPISLYPSVWTHTLSLLSYANNDLLYKDFSA